MKNYLSFSVTIILLVILIFSGYYTVKLNIHQPTTITTQPPVNFNYEPLLASFTTILLFFLKYFLYDKRVKNSSNLNNKNHVFFEYVDELITNDLETIQLATEGRTQLYKYLMKTELELFKKNLKLFIEENKNFENSEEFRKKVRDVILNTMRELKQLWEENEVPLLVIQTYKEIQYERLQILLNTVDNVAIYSSGLWDRGIFEILNHISSFLQLTLTDDTVSVFTKLNGKLTGKKFKGMVL